MARSKDLQITKMSSRGQIVIPEGIRDELDLHAGSTFVVFGKKEADAIMLKKLEFPEPSKAFDEMAQWGEKHAKSKGLDTSASRIVENQHKRRK
ncbi:AbrB/MazE/SpoVT family DNA-binding domain-containing protein [Candidatus Micrarchaeota archaeon]|nr:AbrB/MazE/SpoVT family DNA-binding domain-containing protein [Candidatus Micrarchaeota archaeon]